MTQYVIAAGLAPFTNPKDGLLEETRSGIPIYYGNALGYDEWVFRVKVKKNAAERVKDTKPEILVELGSKVVEGMRGEALRIAMDLGVEQLGKEGGVQKLMDKVAFHITPLRAEEAKALGKAARPTVCCPVLLESRYWPTPRGGRDGGRSSSASTRRSSARPNCWPI